MFTVLAHRTYARLFTAQMVALLGTGLMTVALGLLAYELAGDQAGAVLGTAYAIKMVAYVGLAPITQALTDHLPRKAVLIGADLIRASVALSLPFIDAVWQVYVLIFVLQAASASFTPAYQALIPDVLPDEHDYTNALSLSRLAYELENLFSPVLAGLLLLVTSFHGLFAGTSLGFVLSAVLVLSVAVPPAKLAAHTKPFRQRVLMGSRIYLATPRLRGLLGMNLAASAAGAFVLVNTVVVVLDAYGGTEPQVALAMAAFGLGAMVAAMALPGLLERYGDRAVMLPGAILLVAGSLGLGALVAWSGWPGWGGLLLIYGILGVGYSVVQTPGGRLIKRSAHAEERPALFTAQFALSHFCWLITYPVAGWVGRAFGMAPALFVLGLMAAAGLWAALRFWPADMDDAPVHDHSDLPADHPHLRSHPLKGLTHRHDVVIDEAHPHWPA